MTPGLILVVPCYNEAARFPEQKFDAFLGASTNTALLFVDDGSTDSTLESLQRVVSAHPANASSLHIERNSGKAEAVRRGLLQAIARGPRYVGFWDADLATPLDATAEFLSVLDENAAIDWVIGSRVKLLGRRIERRATRHYVGRVFATAVSMLLRVAVYDTQCGAKVFRLNPLLAKSLAEPFRSRWIFDVELMGRYLSQLRTTGVEPPESRIYELPLRQWVDVGVSKVRLRDFVVAPLELFTVWRALRRLG